MQPGFRADIQALLEGSPHTWLVLETFRSMARSQALYDLFMAGKGPRAAPPGQSAHNFGLAVDVVLDVDPVKPGLQPSWDTNLPGWLWLRGATLVHPRLKGGWKFGDWPHIERLNWRKHI